jgi:TonB family protein
MVLLHSSKANLRVALLLLTWTPGLLPAQNVLIAEHDGRRSVVQRARDDRLVVEEGGKLVEILPTRMALHKVEEYLPEFISVKNIAANATSLDARGAQINSELHFMAEFESPYALADPFLVLDLTTEGGDSNLYCHEIGSITPGKTRVFGVTVRLPGVIWSGQYVLHVFAGGREILTSLHSPQEREAALDKMVLKRVAGVQQAGPKFFHGPVPLYPESLKPTRQPGEVKVAVHLNDRGAVMNPVVQSASDPAFGESALAAVRLWRFLPQVKEGKPVETSAVIPLHFNPPDRTD